MIISGNVRHDKFNWVYQWLNKVKKNYENQVKTKLKDHT